MKLLPDNPTQFDYLHAIRAVASRCGHKEIFDLADAGMQLRDVAVEPVPVTGASVIEKLHDILSDGGYVCCREPLDPSATFADLDMDSLDITRLVVECDNAFGIRLDIESDYPKDIGDLVNLIDKQLP